MDTYAERQLVYMVSTAVSKNKPMSIGQYWRNHKLFELFVSDIVLTVSYVDHVSKSELWSVNFNIPVFESPEKRWYESMASQYIAAATIVVEGDTTCGSPVDPVLFKDRPAIAEFMSSLEGRPGVARDPSILMVSLTSRGVRVGLKDDTVGGWVWREEATFSKALDAIEKALASGKPAWQIPGGKAGRKGRR